MVRFVWSQIRHRAGRTTILVIGVALASASVVLLTGVARTSQIQITGTVQNNFRSATTSSYDPPERRPRRRPRQGWSRATTLSGLYGGITMRQYRRIEALPGRGRGGAGGQHRLPAGAAAGRSEPGRRAQRRRRADLPDQLLGAQRRWRLDLPGPDRVPVLHPGRPVPTAVRRRRPQGDHRQRAEAGGVHFVLRASGLTHGARVCRTPVGTSCATASPPGRPTCTARGSPATQGPATTSATP